MELFSNIEINIIGLVLILIVVFNMPLKKNKILFDQKIFLSLIIITACIIILDILQLCLEGKQGFLFREIQYSIVIIFFCLNPIPCVLYTIYCDYQIYHNPLRIKKLLVLLMLPIIFNAILTLLSPVYHFIFYYDSKNSYHRGNYFMEIFIICIIYISLTIVFIIVKRKQLKRNDFNALLIFSFPPLIGGVIQTFYYGVTLLWVCVSISILIVYIKIQNSNIYTDYLTGLNNRRQLDVYLKEMMNRRLKNTALAGMMIDINDFKKINDLYGHDMGDQALKNTSKIIKKSFGKDDFIGRYGGDEFITIFEIKEKNDMKRAVKRIRKHTENFNNAKKAPYHLSLSAGYDLFDYDAGMTVHQFIKHIDQLMYEDKKKQKNQ